MKLGEKIKLVRMHRGLTQRELGERLCLNGNVANRIAQYESGFRKPKESRTKEIAKALNIREENFFTRAETPEDIIRTMIWYDWEHGCGGSVPIDTILLFDDLEEVGVFLKEWYSQKKKLRMREISRAKYLEWMLQWPCSGPLKKRMIKFSLPSLIFGDENRVSFLSHSDNAASLWGCGDFLAEK